MALAIAPTLAFAHYFGGSRRSWEPLLGALGGGLRSCAPDLPGFGNATLPDGGLDLEAYASCLEDLANGGDWIAVGHSMGGKIALSAALRGANKLKALILIAPSPAWPEPMTEDERQKAIIDYGDRAAARAHIARITADTLTPDAFERCVADQLAVAKPSWLWWLQAGSRADISGRLASLDLPALVIVGDNDQVLGMETVAQLARQLPRAELHIVSRGGHLVPLEQPETVAELMRRFLEGLAARSD